MAESIGTLPVGPEWANHLMRVMNANHQENRDLIQRGLDENRDLIQRGLNENRDLIQQVDERLTQGLRGLNQNHQVLSQEVRGLRQRFNGLNERVRRFFAVIPQQ